MVGGETANRTVERVPILAALGAVVGSPRCCTGFGGARWLYRRPPVFSRIGRTVRVRTAGGYLSSDKAAGASEVSLFRLGGSAHFSVRSRTRSGRHLGRQNRGR